MYIESCDTGKEYVMISHLSLLRIQSSYQWLETGHGNGPCGGVGNRKQMADIAVKQNTVITNGDEFFGWASTANTRVLSGHHQRDRPI